MPNIQKLYIAFKVAELRANQLRKLVEEADKLQREAAKTLVDALPSREAQQARGRCAIVYTLGGDRVALARHGATWNTFNIAEAEDGQSI